MVAGLGAEDAILVVDETGDLKKGSHTVGVQRQYTGAAGRVENAQVAVYLTYATDAGHAFIDRELYLPKCWAEAPSRRAQAGVPDEVEFATKPTLARRMITRALDAGVGVGWVSGDEVYGADPVLRREMETRGVGYVLAVGSDRRVVTGAGLMRADQAARALPRNAWHYLSAGNGAKAHACITGPWSTPTNPGTGGFSSDATPPPMSWPTTAATHPTRCRYRGWSPWPGAAGASKKASRPAKACVASTNTRSVAGPPGTAGPSWPWPRTPTSPSSPPVNDQHRHSPTI